MNLDKLLDALRRSGGKLKNFRDILRYLEKRASHVSERGNRDAQLVISILVKFAYIGQLNVTDECPNSTVYEHRIDLDEVIRRQEAVYFWLPAGTGAPYMSELGRLILFSLLMSHLSHQLNYGRSARTFMFVDEAQIISAGIDLILQQAASAGLSLTLAFQTLEDLRTRNIGPPCTLTTNRQWNLSFGAVGNEERNRIVDSSGTRIGTRTTWHPGADGGPLVASSFTETVEPRYDENQVIAATSHPDLGIYTAYIGRDYMQYGGVPHTVQVRFHITAAEYHRRNDGSWWPAGHPGTVITGRDGRIISPWIEENFDAATVMKASPKKGEHPQRRGRKETRHNQPPAPVEEAGPAWTPGQELGGSTAGEEAPLEHTPQPEAKKVDPFVREMLERSDALKHKLWKRQGPSSKIPLNATTAEVAPHS